MKSSGRLPLGNMALPYRLVHGDYLRSNENDANQAKQGLLLALDEIVIATTRGVVEDTWHAYGETRLKAVAQIEGVWLTCAVTVRDDIHHIINVYRLREKEVKKWLTMSK
jgi:uncharacterized DUF497 family protein